MVQRGVHCEFTFQNLAVDHCNQCGAEVIPDLDQLTALDLLVIFDRLSFLALQVLVLRIESCVESRLERV